MKRRIVVISDIHLASTPSMMSQPDTLAQFVVDVGAARRDGEQHELVIAGDFVDFLAEQPGRAFTSEPVEACAKLEAIFEDINRPIAEALGRAVKDGLALTVLAGNHDLEFCFPDVQAKFCELLDANSQRAVRFVTHGEAYRVGGLLVEHGNRYDGANENDWDGVRALVSSYSRGSANREHEAITHAPSVVPSAGSRLVAEVINPIRSRYPFITLLQPEGVLTALLLRVLEPSLAPDWNQVVAVLTARRAHGAQAPRGIHNISGQEEPIDRELEAAFKDDYLRLLGLPGERQIGVTDWYKLFVDTRPDSFHQLVRREEPLPRQRLQKLQLLLRKIQCGNERSPVDGPVGACGERAALMTSRGDVQTVVMGHTHEARRVGPPDRASYINTGTWADVITVPGEVFEQTDAGLDSLELFLRKLDGDKPGCRDFFPTFADVVIEDNRIVRAELCKYDEGRFVDIV